VGRGEERALAKAKRGGRKLGSSIEKKKEEYLSLTACVKLGQRKKKREVGRTSFLYAAGKKRRKKPTLISSEWFSGRGRERKKKKNDFPSCNKRKGAGAMSPDGFS